MDARPGLDVAGVTLCYSTSDQIVTATYRVSFHVAPGDRFILLGPSGCGKSSLLKAVGGYMAPVALGDMSVLQDDDCNFVVAFMTALSAEKIKRRA